MGRKGTKTTTVSLLVGDTVITRRKSETENSYKIDRRKLVAFGKQGVPDDVKKVLALDALNFQSQHDPVFWLSDSAGEVSRQLNKIVDLAVIDKTTKNINSMLRQSSITISVIAQRKDDAKKGKRRWRGAVQLKRSLDLVRKLDEELEAAAQEALLLDECVQDTIRASLWAERLKKGSVKAAKASRAAQTFIEAYEAADQLKLFLNDVSLLSELVSLALPATPPIEDYFTAANQVESLDELIKDTETWQENAFRIQQSLKTQETYLSRRLRKGCPLCGAVPVRSPTR